MKTIAYDIRMQISNGVKTFDIQQVTKFGTRTISRATVASGLDFTTALKYAESVRDRVNEYNAMKGA